MSGRIFISYRRENSAAHTGRIYDRLAGEFGEGSLFMDVDSIPLGSDFVKVLQKEVTSCDVLLAIIGPNWADACDKSGRRRLDDPHDFVRVEISTALERDIPVIPILLDGTSIPERDTLPDVLKGLSQRNGLRVRHESFQADVEKLTGFLRGRFPSSQTSVSPSACSSDKLCKVFCMFTAKVCTDPSHDLRGAEQAGRFDNGPLPMHPMRCNRIQPGTFDR